MESAGEESVSEYVIGWLVLKQLKIWGIVIFVVLVLPPIAKAYSFFAGHDTAWYIAAILAAASAFWKTAAAAAEQAYTLSMNAYQSGQISVSRDAAVNFLSAVWYLYALGAIRSVFGTVGDFVVALFALVAFGASMLPI